MFQPKSFMALTSILVLISQPIASAEISKLSAQSLNASNDTVVPESFDKEMEASKKQIEESAPEDTVNSTLPPTGKVISSPKAKLDAGRDSTMILGQTPADRKKMPAKTADGRPTVALALGGGGARGAAHIGILRVFQEEGIPIDYIVGNSMGAIVGGLYCAGTSLNDITDCLENGSLQHAYMPSSLPIKILTSSASKMLHPFSSKHYAGLWSGKKLTRYLDNVLPRPNMDVSETQIPFSAVATNLLDGKAYRISSGRLSTAIKASSAISPLIQPVALNDKVYVDGGVRANLPASAARDTGAGVVIAVLIDEPLQKVPAKRFRHLKNIGSRMADIVLAIADERQLQFADIVINPDVSGISILSKKSSDAEKAIHAGELAARQALPGLRQKLGLSTVTASSSAKSIHTIQNSRLE